MSDFQTLVHSIPAIKQDLGAIITAYAAGYTTSSPIALTAAISNL
jgi:hypothetical protein